MVIIMNFADFISNSAMVLRGFVKGARLDKRGSLLRIERGVRIMKRRGEISVGNRVLLHRFVKLSAYGGKIEIGNNTYIGDRTEIHSGQSVKIGNNVNIAWDCNILDRDYHGFESETERIEPIEICDNVWIGCGSYILKGVTLGEGSVVAAGSVVTKDVPKACLVAGNPARVIKENVWWKA